MYETSVVNPFRSEYFFWIDAGYGHGKRTPDYRGQVFPDINKVRIPSPPSPPPLSESKKKKEREHTERETMIPPHFNHFRHPFLDLSILADLLLLSVYIRSPNSPQAHASRISAHADSTVHVQHPRTRTHAYTHTHAHTHTHIHTHTHTHTHSLTHTHAHAHAHAHTRTHTNTQVRAYVSPDQVFILQSGDLPPEHCSDLRGKFMRHENTMAGGMCLCVRSCAFGGFVCVGRHK